MSTFIHRVKAKAGSLRVRMELTVSAPGMRHHPEARSLYDILRAELSVGLRRALVHAASDADVQIETTVE